MLQEAHSKYLEHFYIFLRCFFTYQHFSNIFLEVSDIHISSIYVQIDDMDPIYVRFKKFVKVM